MSADMRADNRRSARGRQEQSAKNGRRMAKRGPHQRGKQTAGIGGPLEKFERAAAFHENTARIIREAMKAYAEYRQNPKRDDSRAAAFAAIDQGRTAPARTTSQPGYGASTTQRERRQATADFLAVFDQITPRDAPEGKEQSVGPLIMWGYLKKKGDGYIRTAKEFRIDKRA